MINTGSKYIDENIGGFKEGEITIIYGPPASGKTTLCLLTASLLSTLGKKVIYVDTEKSFSVERIEQMHKENCREALKNILVLRTDDFDKQHVFTKKLLEENFDLLVVDSLTNNYRKFGEKINANKIMAIHLKDIAQIAREKNVPVLCTGQVYMDLDSGNFQIVGGNMLKNWSKCLIRLEKDETRRMLIEKHETLPQKILPFKITEKGIENV